MTSYVLLQLTVLRMGLEGFGFEIIQAGILSHCSLKIVKNTNLIHTCKPVHHHITISYHLSAFRVER